MSKFKFEQNIVVKYAKAPGVRKNQEKIHNYCGGGGFGSYVCV